MGARATGNVVLLAVVMGLAWLAFTGEEPPPPQGLPLTTLDPGAIERISLERGGRRVAVLARDADGWRLVEPLEARADPFRVRALLTLASAESDTGFRAAGNDLSQYGLQPPQAIVRFDATPVQVGGTESVSGRRYLLSGDQVHLLEDRWFGAIAAGPAAWVDPRPLPEGARVVALELPAARWTLVDGRWQRDPADPRLSADAGPTLVQSWQRARALAVRPLDPSLDWRERVLIRTRDAQSPLVLEVARIEDAVLFAHRDLGVQYRFLARQGAVLLGEPAGGG